MEKKIKLQIDELEVTAFSIDREKVDTEGTVVGHSTIYSCSKTYLYDTCLCNTDDPDWCA